MFKTELIVGTGANTVSLDLKDDLPISLNFNIADIKKPENRNGAYSKTITLWGTKINNQFFEHTYDVNITTSNFNPNLKTDCYIIQDGSVVFEGYLRLMGIETIIENNVEEIKYEVSIFADNNTLFAEVGDSKLQDLDLSAYDHTFNRVNQYNSWTATQGVGYVYPLIDYGKNAFNFNQYKVEDFRPAVYAKQYIDSIFSAAGKSYTSTFLNTAFFKSLIIPHNGEKLQMSPGTQANYEYFVGDDGTTGASNVGLTEISSVSSPNGLDYHMTNATSGSSTTFTTIFNDETTSPYSDPGANYDNTTGITTISGSGIYTTKCVIKFEIKFNHSAAFTLVRPNQSTGGTYIRCRLLRRLNSSSAWYTPSGEDQFILVGAGATWSGTYSVITANFNVSPQTYQVGEQFKIMADFAPKEGVNWGVVYYNGASQLTGGTASYDIRLTTGASIKTSIDPTLMSGQSLVMNDAIPRDIKQKDFLKSIIQLFNLYLDIDPTNKDNYLIEPRDDYYAGGTIIDWSEKLAWDKPFIIKPMAEIDAKKFIYKYKDDQDYYNKQYQDSYQESYGQHTQTITNDFTKNDNKTEVIFSPTPTVDNINNNILIPFIASYDGTNVKSLKHNLRILMYNGVVTNNNPTWTYLAPAVDALGAASLPMTTYPQAAMTNNPTAPTETIEFGVPNEVYYSLGVNYTTNNLYNRFYSKMMNEITDRDSKLVTAFFYLEPIDIANFDFRNTIFVKDAYYIVNKIMDYNPLVKGLTKVELLKLKAHDSFVESTPSIGTLTTNNGTDGLKVAAPSTNTGNANNVLIGNNNNTRSQGSFVSGSNNTVANDSYRITLVSTDFCNVASACSGVTITNSSGCIVDYGCMNVTLNNCQDVIVNNNVHDFVGINLSSVVIDTSYSGKTMIGGELFNTAGVWDSKTASFSVDANVQFYEIDCTAGDVTATFDPTVYDYTHKVFYFKRVDSSANLFKIDELTGTPNIDGNAVPYDTGATQWDCIVIGNNGTNYRIL